MRSSTICFKCILKSQAARDAQQPRPPRQQPVERRTLRRCELRAAESEFERVCDEVRRGKSSQGSTCTGPRRKCVVADQEVDPHAAHSSSCTQRRWSSDIPTSSLWQKTADGRGAAHQLRNPKDLLAGMCCAGAGTSRTAVAVRRGTEAGKAPWIFFCLGGMCICTNLHKLPSLFIAALYPGRLAKPISRKCPT